ncbi:MAG: glycosyltransferase family 39 protein [Planctomycetota bacterium]|jgi:hypothetical protein
MSEIHTLSLVILGIAWLVAFAAGLRWCRHLAIADWPARVCLATVIPAAALVGSVHALALASMLLETAWVAPMYIAPLNFIPVLLIVRWTGRRIATEPRDSIADRETFSDPPATGRWMIPMIIVAGCYVVFAIDALTRFPHGADALHYHLPVAARWMQTQRMDLIFGLTHQSLPENGMIVPCLMMFAGLDRAINLAQFPNAIIVALAVFSLSRSAGAGTRAAIGGACIAASVPMVIFQSSSGYIDLYGATAWLMALLGIVQAFATVDAARRTRIIVLAGLAAGIAMGSKSTYLLLVPFLLVALLLINRTGRSSLRLNRQGAVVLTLVFATATLPCSVHWFARGAWQAGNPIYPVTFKIGDSKILPGFTVEEEPHFEKRTASEKITRWWDYPWRETKHSGSGYPYGRGNGLGAAYATFVPLGLVMTLWWRRRPARSPLPYVYALLALAGMAILVTVFAEMLRFVLALVLVAVPLGALLLQRIESRFPRAAFGLLTVSLSITTLLAVFEPVHDLAGRWRDQAWSREAFYGMPPSLESIHDGATVLNLSNAYETWALMGPRRNHQVITPTHWSVMTGAMPMTTNLLDKHKIEFIYASVDESMRWPVDLPVVPLPYGEGTPSVMFSQPGRLYYVLPEVKRRNAQAASAMRGGQS